ncbi:UNVERIFIED_CONTAM: hypothetical protein H355_005085, partial [Colinus virginianus]
MDVAVDLYLAVPLLFTVLAIVLASVFVKLRGGEGQRAAEQQPEPGKAEPGKAEPGKAEPGSAAGGEAEPQGAAEEPRAEGSRVPVEEIGASGEGKEEEEEKEEKEKEAVVVAEQRSAAEQSPESIPRPPPAAEHREQQQQQQEVEEEEEDSKVSRGEARGKVNCALGGLDGSQAEIPILITSQKHRQHLSISGVIYGMYQCSEGCHSVAKSQLGSLSSTQDVQFLCCLINEDDPDSDSEKLVVKETEDEDAADETFSFKYSPGKLRGNQYKSMMTKEELEEEQ